MGRGRREGAPRFLAATFGVKFTPLIAIEFWMNKVDYIQQYKIAHCRVQTCV